MTSFFRPLIRTYCTKKWLKNIPPVRKAVIVSTSNDIFTNLAFEDWIYRNQLEKFKDDHILMLWVNNPCVVIGRHQNPWSESNVPTLPSMGVKLARRNSGGGTVYHDTGNLNLTFFTPRQHYNRHTNLQFIADCVAKEYGLKIDISPREDLILREFKVSGTASKLGKSAYHHCTLLLKADKERLKHSLKPLHWDIKTNATKSISSKTLNLFDEQDISKDGCFDDLYRVLGTEYLSYNNLNRAILFGNVAEINRQFHLGNEAFKSDCVNMESLKMQIVTPTEQNYPGLDEVKAELNSWQWIYGKTPKFTASKGFKISTAHTKPTEERIIYTRSRTYIVLLSVEVENGMITHISVQKPDICTEDRTINAKLDKTLSLRGEKFSEETLAYLETLFEHENLPSKRIKN